MLLLLNYNKQNRTNLNIKEKYSIIRYREILYEIRFWEKKNEIIFNPIAGLL